ncbi:MAG: hypothetical protein Q4F66_11700, partial [Clostridium sp.]|nr:hypothetical protein [Clostridium sp.]
DDPSDDPTDDGNDDSSDGADDDNNDDDDDENWPDDDYNSSDNIVNINDKIYFLDDEYKLYYSNTDGSNKTYLYDFTLNNKNTIVRYMKGYGVYIYYISYEYVNEKYICIIRRYNTITEVLEEVVNLNNKFDINIKYEYINKITFYIEANIIFINYIGKTYTFNLSQISGENTTIIINNKVYYLSEDYKLYSSNIDGSNNKYVYDLTLNKKNTIIKYMKAYDNQLYYISYEYVNGKYIGIINRFDIETGRVYEVINLNEVLNIDIKYEHLTIIYFYIKNRILYIDYMGTIRTFNLSNFIEGSSNDLYLEALEYVRTFEKKLTHSTYKKALNAVRELSESDKKDKLLKRIKEAKKEMDREDTDIDDSYEENLYQDNNTVIIPFGTQLNDVLSPLHNSVNIGALNSINSYNNSYNPALPGQWIFTEGNWYHVNDDLRFTTGWLKYNNSMYYFDSNGAMATGWRNIGNNTYCFTDEGVMITGWIKDDNTGKWYYLQDDGTMVRGTVKCGYLFGSDGAWIDK